MSERRPREEIMRRWERSDLPVSGTWAERRRLADVMRTVIERMITSDAPEAELRDVADRLERYAEHLTRHPRRRSYPSFAESANVGADDELAERLDTEGGGLFDFSPLIGRANPLAPPIVMRSQGEAVHGYVTFGSAYEGPPGCVHGGCVAAAFDEVLGYAQAHTGNPGMTGTLKIRFRSPTPLHVALTFRAEVDRVDGRKIFASGTLHAGEKLCADAEGIFISFLGERFQALLEKRREREPTPAGAGMPASGSNQ